MEDKQVLVKTITKSYDSKIKAGITWFQFISAINNIKLAKRELELLAFINYRGTISSLSAKKEFCKIFGSSMGTVTNMTPRLLKKNLLIKEKTRKVRINPALVVDFDKDVAIRFFIKTNINQETINDTD